MTRKACCCRELDGNIARPCRHNFRKIGIFTVSCLDMVNTGLLAYLKGKRRMLSLLFIWEYESRMRRRAASARNTPLRSNKHQATGASNHSLR